MSQRGAGKRDWGGWTCEDKYRRPRIRRNKDSGDGTTRDAQTSELSGQQNMKSMTELAGGGWCLPQRPYT